MDTATRNRTATLPGGRFPMPDQRHAQLALDALTGRGGMNKAKNLSASDAAKIRARANAMLGGARTQAAAKAVRK